jgi:environmental stress-induced protein Ves
VSAELIEWRGIAPRPWKNAAGLTRELGVSPPGADATSFDWRISIAELTRNAPFSAFPGVDRCILLLAGTGVVLREAGGAWHHRLSGAFSGFDFSGDDTVDAELIDGASQDLNVMTRRGRCRSEVAVVRAEHRVDSADAGLLLCCEGAWHDAGSNAVLRASQALLWRAAMPSLHLQPEGGAASLVVVRFMSGEDPA